MKDLEKLATALSTSIKNSIDTGKVPAYSTNTYIADVVGNLELMKSSQRGESELWTESVYHVAANADQGSAPLEYTNRSSKIAKQVQRLAAYYGIVNETI